MAVFFKNLGMLTEEKQNWQCSNCRRIFRANCNTCSHIAQSSCKRRLATVKFIGFKSNSIKDEPLVKKIGPLKDQPVVKKVYIGTAMLIFVVRHEVQTAMLITPYYVHTTFQPPSLHT